MSEISLVSGGFNFLPNDKVLDSIKLKALADDKLNVAQMVISDFHGKHCRKKRKLGLPEFSPFSTMFLKSFFLWVVNMGIMWQKHCWNSRKC